MPIIYLYLLPYLCSEIPSVQSPNFSAVKGVCTYIVIQFNLEAKRYFEGSEY